MGDKGKTLPAEPRKGAQIESGGKAEPIRDFQIYIRLELVAGLNPAEGFRVDCFDLGTLIVVPVRIEEGAFRPP